MRRFTAQGGIATGCALGAAALYAGLMALYHPYRDIFAFDPDEGINAIKALLVARGDALYAQIWSDQPPLFTYLLRFWFGAIGWDIDSGRLLVVLFGAACLFALYDTVRLAAGHGAALIACFLLVASGYFTRLSIALMLGVPALALATLALWALFRWQRGGGRGWIATAGVLMGCSLACKLLTALLLPAFAIWLAAIAPRRAAVGRAWPPAVVWLLITIAAAGALLLFLTGPRHLPALLDTHLAARRAPRLTFFGAGGLLLTAFAEWPLTLLGLAAYGLVLHWRLRLAAVFPLWAAFAAAGLLSHAPIWYHHQLLFSLPHCAAAGIALAELFRRDASAARMTAPLLTGMRIAAAGLVAVLPLWSIFGQRLPAPTRLAGAPERVLAAMRRFATVTHVVVASDPMYAFRAGYAVPPALAALPLKRVATDAQLPAAIHAAFAQHPPEQVVLSAGSGDALGAWIRQAMADRYRLLLEEAGTELFVRRDLVPDAP